MPKLNFAEIKKAGGAALEEEVTDADILEIKLLKKVLEAVDEETVPSLEILNGSAQGKRFFLTDDIQEMVIGRDPSCDLAINEYVISRRHATVSRKWGGIALTDLESKNGTYINNKRITEEFLHDGDRIALGTIVLLFRNPKEIDLKEISEEIIRKMPPLRPKTLYTQKSPKGKTEKSEEGIEEGTPAAEEASEALLPAQQTPANIYPSPVKKEKPWTPLEIGMMGLGIIVLSFALITLVNLLME